MHSYALCSSKFPPPIPLILGGGYLTAAKCMWRQVCFGVYRLFHVISDKINDPVHVLYLSICDDNHKSNMILLCYTFQADIGMLVTSQGVATCIWESKLIPWNELQSSLVAVGTSMSHLQYCILNLILHALSYYSII